MEVNGKILIHCSECGKLVCPSQETIEMMELLDLNDWDVKIKCSDCKIKDYYSLLRSVERIC